MVHGELKQIIMTEEEYHILFPKIQVNFTKNDLVFLINQVKSRHISTLHFKLHCYDKYDEKIYVYTSPRWVITEEYTKRVRTFSISDDVYDKVLYTQIELIALGNSSENPLYFTECMFAEYNGDIIEYHQPSEAIRDVEVGFINSRYVNLYNANGDYLQVIRPTGRNIFTNTISKDVCTVLAPHLAEEMDIDDPVNVFMEFLNQTDQRIDVLR